MNAIPKPVREPKAKRYIPRSNSGGRLIGRAERACSKLAEKRALGVCECCGASGDQTAHGYGKKAHPAVRFDGRNLYWTCNPCARRSDTDRVWWKAEQIRILGHQQFNALMLRTQFGHMDSPRDVLAAASAGRFLIERQP